MTTNGSPPNGAQHSAERVTPLPGARGALVLLLAINLFNYIDRYVLADLIEPIRLDLLPNDEHANARMGSLAGAFLISYILLSPIFGWLADRMSRWLLVGVGVALWSLASGGSGWAPAFAVLFLTRCFVGVGEAAYGPVAPTIISDYYPAKIRGTVLAWFYAAIPVGSALGYALGDVAKMAAPNWRWAFYAVVPPGLLLGLLCFWMRDPVRGQAEAAPSKTDQKAHWRDYLALARIPSYVLDTLGMTAMTFAMGGLAYWMPPYLDEVHAPSVGPLGPGVVFGGLTALAGFLATLAGGFVGDWLRPRFPGSYFLVSGVSMVIGFPMLLLVLWSPFPWTWFCIFVAVFTLFFNTGPTNTILANVTPAVIRASAFAFNILIIHLLGDVLSPTIIGAIRDRTGSLHGGFVLVSVMMIVGGILWIWGARYLERDTRLAPTLLEPAPPET